MSYFAFVKWTWAIIDRCVFVVDISTKLIDVVDVVQPLLRSRGAAIIRTPITGCGPRSKCGAASLDTGDSRHAVLGLGTRVQIADSRHVSSTRL